MKILLAAATEGEIAPTLLWLRENTVETGENLFTPGATSVQVCLTGVGIMAATESLTRATLTTYYDFALQAGVAGTFDRSIPLGDVVRVESEVLADLGAEDQDGLLLDVYALGLAGRNDPPFCDGKLLASLPEGAPGAAFGRLRGVAGVTVQTVSGSAATIAARATRHAAEVETMEGAPFHYCCLKSGVPFVQLRALSNYVEPRDRDAWKIGEAITALNAALVGALELWMRDTL